jgi:hypothetical protein
MSHPNSILFALYRRALWLYPSCLRLLYQDQMLQTLRDADSDRVSSAAIFWIYLFADLLKSSVKERLLMARNQVIARPIFFYTLTLAVLLTLWGFPAAITMQQLLRRGADQPQIQMAQNYASAIAEASNPSPDRGMSPASAELKAIMVESSIVPPRHLDLSTTLEPFVILYDVGGKPLLSTGNLDGAIPVPPAGVFAYLRTHPADKFTWQPSPGLRIAAVAQRVDAPRIDGSQPGFILVGRSLALVQQQEDLLRRGTFITWFCLMALLIAGAYFLNRFQRQPRHPHPAGLGHSTSS